MMKFASLVHYAGQSIIVSLVNAGKTLVKIIPPSMRLIHLTDPHLSSLDLESFRSLQGKRRSGYLSWHRNRRHEHRPEILDQLTGEVANHEADQVLVTGDLIHIGLESEMIEAANWLRRLGPPEKVMFVPGNHDNYAANSLPAMYRHWADYLPSELPPDGDYTTGYPLVRDLNGVRLVGVNTACVTRIFSAAGELGDDQRQRLAGSLEKHSTGEEFTCLLIHHPPFPGMTRRRKALKDDAQLLELARQNPPDLVLYGHIHLNRENLQGRTHSFCTASASSVDKASFRVIDLEKEQKGWHCRVRLFSLDQGDSPRAAFKLTAESTWQTESVGADLSANG
jgi:3',5'-cyclic AMP phosphodiesterase CpdA